MHVDINNLNIIAIIPIRGKVEYLKDKPLLSYTIEAASKSKYLKRIIASTDNIETAEIAKGLGAETPFLRDSNLSEDYIDIDRVIQHSLEKIESLDIYPDILVTLEVTFPFRPSNVIDNMIEELFKNGLDSIIAAKCENKSIWKGKDGKIELIEEGLTPRQYKDASYIGLRGVCCVTHPEFLREGNMLGQNIGIYAIDNPVVSFEVRNKRDFVIAGKLVELNNIL
jgi:CMP-N-acetylneuraminic acid synthetase